MLASSSPFADYPHALYPSSATFSHIRTKVLFSVYAENVRSSVSFLAYVASEPRLRMRDRRGQVTLQCVCIREICLALSAPVRGCLDINPSATLRLCPDWLLGVMPLDRCLYGFRDVSVHGDLPLDGFP